MSKCQKNVELSERCQIVKKMSNVKKSNIYRLCRRFTKKLIDIIRFTHIDVSFDIKYEGHPNWSNYFLCTFWGFLVTIIFDIKIDVNVCEPHYVIIFFVNLLHSSCVCLFDIWHLFDNLTHYLNLVSSVMGWGGLSYMSVSKCQKDVKFPYMLCACAWHHTYRPHPQRLFIVTKMAERLPSHRKSQILGALSTLNTQYTS